jgi:hypothetical protein
MDMLKTPEAWWSEYWRQWWRLYSNAAIVTSTFPISFGGSVKVTTAPVSERKQTERMYPSLYQRGVDRRRSRHQAVFAKARLFQSTESVGHDEGRGLTIKPRDSEWILRKARAALLLQQWHFVWLPVLINNDDGTLDHISYSNAEQPIGSTPRYRHDIDHSYHCRLEVRSRFLRP